MKKQMLAMAVAAALATPAMAQSLNIDLNAVQGIPPSTYGAAAGQMGFWNNLNSAALGATLNLSDLSGAATSAVWTNVTGAVLFSSATNPIPAEHIPLMRDGFDLGTTGPDNFSISGLQAGMYDVYVYAWAPDSTAFVTGVSVNGAPQVGVGGDASAGLAVGTTHALFTNVSIAAGGTVNINITPLVSFGTINGVQLVLIPGPGAVALLGLAGLVGTRRRRN